MIVRWCPGMQGREIEDRMIDRRGPMRRVSLGFALAVLVLSLAGAVPASGQLGEKGSEEQKPVALDLMDLDIPGEGSEDQLELPPIQETQSPAPVTPASPSPERPAEAKMSPAAGSKAGAGSAASPLPGMIPFLLEGSVGGQGTTKAATKPTGASPPVTSVEDLPAELKTVPPPPSHAGGLKVPSGADGKASGESALPEIPMLREEAKGQQAPGVVGTGSSLTMKPLPDLHGTPASDKDAGLAPEDRRPEDYLQVREDIDSRLIEIYERFYKRR